VCRGGGRLALRNDDDDYNHHQGKGTLHRVDEVFDCWFESGAMPYAQVQKPVA
jgi:isoleucyl-tRNA synthetase